MRTNFFSRSAFCLSIIIAAMVIFVSCETGNGVKQTKALQFSPAEKQMVQHCNDFSFNLLAQAAANEQSENIILSPLSASMLLGMLMNGADGETLAQIREMLGFEDAPIDEINDYYRQLIDVLPALDQYTLLNLANGIWVAERFPLQADFVQACHQSFDAEAKNVPTFVDDNVLADINRFAAAHTNNRIKDIIDRSMVDDNTVMALVNALYFKAKWKDKFKATQTHKQKFTTLNGVEIQTDFMHRTDEMTYNEGDDFQLLELPYKGSKYCADIILPAEGIDIRTFVASMDAERWHEMTSGMQYPRVELALPKFSLKYQRCLNADLQALGMTDAFSGQADFSRLSEHEAYLSLVNQYTFMQVDEEGTEAAAVTIGLVADKAAEPMDFRRFIADRPFLFVIRERDYGTILFTALIGHPEMQKQ